MTPFCRKESVKCVKRQPIEWEKVFGRYTSDSRLISRTCKELKTLKRKQTIQQKWANEINRQFAKDELQMTEKHRKKHLTSLAMEEVYT